MKRKIACILTGSILTLTACGMPAPFPRARSASEATETEETEAVESEPVAESEEPVTLPNPWTTITEEEANQISADLFTVPEGRYRCKLVHAIGYQRPISAA